MFLFHLHDPLQILPETEFYSHTLLGIFNEHNQIQKTSETIDGFFYLALRL